MTHIDSESKSRIGISHVEGDDYLVMMVARGAECKLHHISLQQARALSLEIIKQVYLAELINGQNGKSSINQKLSFQFRPRPQT